MTIAMLAVMAMLLFRAPAEAQEEWVYKAPIPTGRAYVTCSVLDGKIYVIGGGLTRAEGSAAVERYDPQTDTWDVTIASLPVPLFAPAAATANGKIYAMGGKANYYSTEDYAAVYEYDPMLNTWSEKTSMPNGRSHLTACAFGGYIYAIGGRIGDHIDVKTVERYDPLSDTWVTMDSMQQTRANILAQVVGDKIYIVDGIGDGPSSVESYDPSTDSWKLEDNPPPAVGYFGSATHGGKIYVYGGINNTSPTASLDFFEFDPGTGLWENIGTIPEKKVMCANAVVGNRLYAITGALDPFFIPSLPGPATTASVIMFEFEPSGEGWAYKTPITSPRAYSASGVVDGKIYVIGGAYSKTEISDVVDMYDPETDAWQSRQSLPEPIHGAAAGVIGGKIYVAGGQTQYTTLGMPKKTLFVYDPATDSWEQKAPMPTARGYLSAAVVDGKLYAIGGTSAWPNRTGKVEMYDPDTDSWQTKAPMPTARSGFCAEALNGKIFVMGGVDASGYKDVLEVYDPATDTWIEKMEMPQTRSIFGSAVVNDLLYAYGGALDDVTPLLNIIQYGPETDSWAETDDMPELKAAFASAVADNCIYGIGGALLPFFTGGPGPKVSETVLQYCPSEVNATVELGKAPFVLHQNRPNPFSGQTAISYELQQSGHVSLRVFNLAGREVARLVDGLQAAGPYTVEWNVGKIPAGMYLYQLRTNGFTETKKCVPQQ